MYNGLVVLAMIVVAAVGFLFSGGGLGSGGEVPTPPGGISLDLQEWGFNQAEGGPIINVEKDESVTITIRNVGQVQHNLNIEEFDIDVDVAPGETKTATFVANKAGSFTFLCNIPGHKEAGMIAENSLIVEEEN